MSVNDEALATTNFKLVITNNLVPCHFLMNLAVLVEIAFLAMNVIANVYAMARCRH